MFVMIGFIILLIAAITLLVFYWRKKSTIKSINASNPTINTENQAIYNSTRNQNQQLNMTLAQKVELSWKFLYQITETIMNKFSASAKEELQQIGKVLINNGMKYNHIVDLAIQPLQVRQRSQDIEQDKKKQEGRAI